MFIKYRECTYYICCVCEASNYYRGRAAAAAGTTRSTGGAAGAGGPPEPPPRGAPRCRAARGDAVGADRARTAVRGGPLAPSKIRRGPAHVTHALRRGGNNKEYSGGTESCRLPARIPSATVGWRCANAAMHGHLVHRVGVFVPSNALVGGERRRKRRPLCEMYGGGTSPA